MSRICRVTAVLLGVAMSVPQAAERSSHDFEGHRFSLQLPPGYVLEAETSPRRGFKTFGFSAELRGDGTRGMIQVSLIDFSAAPAGETVSLEKFAAAMIGGVR